MLRIEGKALTCKSFDGSTFIADGCILYNPPIIKAIIEACDNTAESIFIVAGAVSKTAPAAETTSDKVTSKEELRKEAAEIQNGYFALRGKAKAAADARLAAIENALKA